MSSFWHGFEKQAALKIPVGLKLKSNLPKLQISKPKATRAKDLLPLPQKY